MKSTHFSTEEWFPKILCGTLKEDQLWGLLDPRLILLVDKLRERYGRIVINNWSHGGNLSESGFRMFSSTTGASWSSHKFGRAADLHFAACSPDQIREDFKKTPPEFLTEVELDTPTWVHVSTRNIQQEGILWLPKP